MLAIVDAMTGSNLVREARKLRGLTQRQLAVRLGTTQSAIARLESGKSDPLFETVLAAVRACDLDLHFSLAAPDLDHRRLIEDALALTPAQRLGELVDRLEAEHTLHQARKVS